MVEDGGGFFYGLDVDFMLYFTEFCWVKVQVLTHPWLAWGDGWGGWGVVPRYIRF